MNNMLRYSLIWIDDELHRPPPYFLSMPQHSHLRKIRQTATGATVLAGVVAIATLCLAAFAWAADNKKVVGVTLLSLQYPFLIVLDDAMEAEAAKQGIDLLPFDPQQSVATELSQVEQLVAKKVDLIVMIPVDQKMSQAAAKLINEVGIPLVLLNTKFSDDFRSKGGKFLAYVGSDDNDAGKIEGQYLVDNLPEGGNVVYLVGEYGGGSTERRKAGFESVLKDHPNLKIVSELQGHGSGAKGKTIMKNLLQKFGKEQLQAVVAQNDEMAIGASSAIQAAGRLGEFKVLIGIDGSKPALDAVKAGTLTATVFQDAVGQGTGAMAVARKVLAGEMVEPQLVIPFKLVTKQNVSSFQ
jgi:ABC-type sugar transport system substrate-binding protein